MRKWLVMFLLVGTVSWLYAEHETHQPCQTVRNDARLGRWNCPAGTVRLDLQAAHRDNGLLIISSPAVVRVLSRVYAVRAGVPLFVEPKPRLAVLIDTRLPFTVSVRWLTR